jgi:hypothetical protein
VWWATSAPFSANDSATPYTSRRPSRSTRARQLNERRRTGCRNVVIIPAVTERSRRPSAVLIASHIATSAAAMKTWPLTMPPGRSNLGRNGTSITHSPDPSAATRKP